MTDMAMLKTGWKPVKFGEVVRQVKNKVDPEASGLERYVAGEHMDTDDLRIRRWGEIGDGYLGPAFHMHFKPGQVLYGSRRTYLRKVAVADFEGICANTTFVLEPHNPEELHPQFLPFLMQTDTFNGYSVKNSKGSVNPYINFSDLARFEFALPPMEEQRRIIESLSCLEKYIDSTDHLIASAENLRRSLMIDHFSKKHSEYRKVSEVGKWHSGGTPARGKSEYWGGDIPWISPKDMKLPVLNSAEEKLTAEGIDAGSRLMPKDTILIVVRGMILAHTFPVARTSVPAAFNQDMKALVVNDEYRAKYIQYWFEYSAPYYLRLISESSHGTKRLESENLFSLSVPKISHDEQDELIERVDDVVQAIREASDRRQDTLLIKRHFLNEKVVA